MDYGGNVFYFVIRSECKVHIIMKFYESDIYGKVPMPETLEELLGAVKLHAEDRNNVYMWRGQEDISWKIHSSAYRRLCNNSSNVSESDMQYYEKYLLRHATHQGYRYENNRILSDFELLIKIQHHGGATRLIDFSRNILIGLWFASSNFSKIGLLFGIHSYSLGGGENRDIQSSYSKRMKEIEEIHTHPMTWQPPTVSKRVTAQSSQFIYSPVVDGKFGSLAIENEEGSYFAIAISPDFKEKMKVILSEYFDIRHLTLFPDIDGFGYANSFRFHQFESERW